MNRLQEGTGVRNISKPAESINKPDENLELTHQNTNQQMRSVLQEEIAYTAYDVIEHHKTFQHQQKSYNEVQEQYAEQAFSTSPPQETSFWQNQKPVTSIQQDYAADAGASSIIPISSENSSADWKQEIGRLFIKKQIDQVPAPA